MTQIPPYPLWLGHAGEGRQFKQLFDVGIQAVVELALEEPATQPPRELIYARLPLMDSLGNRGEVLFLAITTVATLLKMQLPTLVVCGAGESRAPAIAAAALSLIYKDEPEACLGRVVEHHSSDVSPGFWSEVKTALKSLKAGSRMDINLDLPNPVSE